METGIMLLDCTLRDGGHINKSKFGESVIKSIIYDLFDSHIEIVEAGFLENCNFDKDVARYNSIAEAKTVLPEKRGTVMYSLMAQEDLYDVEKLEPCDGFIDIIRVSFHDFDIEEGLACCQKIIEKGYKCFINPINIMGYSDEKLLEIIKKVNDLNPYAFTLVDTFGAMTLSDLKRLYYLVDHNLSKGIKIGIHLHENQALSYSLAQTFAEIKSSSRDICIDGSLYGMGRVPGNLCIELIMEYMNRTHGTAYDIEPVYDAIDEYIVDIKKKNPWGYSTAYALSAQHQVHRTFAEYLLDKGKLKTRQINQILSMIAVDKKTRWDKAYIESLYAEYQKCECNDSESIASLSEILSGKEVLIVAPGSSIVANREVIENYCSNNPVVVFSANFVWDSNFTQYAFFSNIRRWDAANTADIKVDTIISSNLSDAKHDYSYIVNYSTLAYFKNQLADNCVLMLIKLLIKTGVTKITFAGFDGFNKENNFALPQFERDANYAHDNLMIKEAVSSLKEQVEMKFLTASAYE